MLPFSFLRLVSCRRDPLPSPPPARTRVRPKPRTSGIESRCNYLLTQVVKELRNSERPFQAAPPSVSSAPVAGDRLGGWYHLSSFAASRFSDSLCVTQAERMLVASRVPVNPSRDFSFRLVVVSISSRFFSGSRRLSRRRRTPEHSPCIVVLPLGCGPSHPCGEEGTRTPDLLLAKQALYQLSYSPAVCR